MSASNELHRGEREQSKHDDCSKTPEIILDPMEVDLNGSGPVNGFGYTHTHTYNEALEIVGEGWFHTVLLFVTGLCLMSVVNETINVGFILPAAECDLGLTFTDKGLVNGAAFLGVVSSSYIWGFLSDTWGRRKVLLLASTGTLIVSVISTFSPHVWVLVATRFLVGVLVSGNAATSYAYLAEFHGEASRAKVISWAAMFMAIGLIFLPSLAWLIIPLEDQFELYLFGMRYAMWRIYLMLCSLDLVLIIAGLLWLPESGKFLLTKGHTEKVRRILAKIYCHNRGKPEHMFPVKLIRLDAIDSGYVEEFQRRSNLGLRYIWEQTMPLFRPPLLCHTAKSAVLMFGLFAASSGLFLWIPDILNTYLQHKNMKLCDVIELMHTNKMRTPLTDAGCLPVHCPIPINANIFLITSAMGVIFLACYVVNGFIINLVGKKKLLSNFSFYRMILRHRYCVLTIIGSIFCSALLSFRDTSTDSWFVGCGICGVSVLWTSDFYLTLILIAAFVSSGCLGGIVSAISVDLFPTNYRAMALCLILMTGRLGAMAGSNLIAYLLTYNCDLIFILFGGLLLGKRVFCLASHILLLVCMCLNWSNFNGNVTENYSKNVELLPASEATPPAIGSNEEPHTAAS